MNTTSTTRRVFIKRTVATAVASVIASQAFATAVTYLNRAALELDQTEQM